MSDFALQLPLQGTGLIEASAGTGKTYTIAALYLRLILGHCADPETPRRPLLPSEILVVTFTEAATKELRDRIRLRLSEAAQYFRDTSAANDAYLDALRQGLSPEQLSQCARRLDLAAQWMDEAAVYTIHGWCNRMLQQHAFDSGALFQQELSSQQLPVLDEAVKDYWRSFYYPLSLDSGLLDKVYDCFASPDVLFEALKRLLDENELPWSEPMSSSIECLVKNHEQNLRQQLSEIKRPWLSWADEIKDLIQQAVSDKVLKGLNYKSNNLESWIEKIRQWAQDPHQVDLDLKTGYFNLSSEGIASYTQPGQVPPQHPGFEVMGQLETKLDELPELSPLLLQHALLWIRQRFAQEKQKRAQLGFNDLLIQLDLALSGKQGEKLQTIIRRQFPVALIDEFQDTDPVQFRIFNRIYPADSQADTACLMIGDPKQAIYSFRGADIFTYLQAYRLTRGRHYTLDTNFRSSAGLVNAVNTLFAKADQHPQGAFLFRQQDEDPLAFKPVKAKGQKDIWQIAAKETAALQIWSMDNPTSISLTEYRRYYAERTAVHIVSLLNDASTRKTGFVNQDTGAFRALLPGDIAVLVRNHKEATLIAQALARRRLRSVYLSAKDTIYTSQEASDVLFWLSAMAEPKNAGLVRSALATATVGWLYTELQQCFSDESLFEIHLERFGQLHQCWSEEGVLPALRRFIHEYGLHIRDTEDYGSERRLTNLLHLAELLQLASMRIEGEQALIRFLGEAIHDSGIAGGDEAILRLESDAHLIQIVTIHKSKGLEYPLVFLPFCCDFREVSAKDDFYRYHDEQQQLAIDLNKQDAQRQRSDFERLQEDMRLLYVAITRAKYVCWLGLAAVHSGSSKKCQLEKSAIGHLLGWQAGTDAGELSLILQQLVQGVPDIQMSSPPAESMLCYQAGEQAEHLEQALIAQVKISDAWWIGSYSALAISQQQPKPILEPESAQDANRWDEAEADSFFQDNSMLSGVSSLPKGSGPGTLIHSLFEQMARLGFSECHAQPKLIDSMVESNLRSNTWRERQSIVSEALVSWLSSSLVPEKPWALKDLKPYQYQPEMEFLITVTQVDVTALDDLLQQHIFPGKPRPALLASQLHGLLKGFIDLVFTQDDQYYLLDYKFNYLGNNSNAYSQLALTEVMLTKRYDLQMALYSLALHRLLKQRLADRYDYHRDFAGCLYVFLRGFDHNGQGRIFFKPSSELIESLDRLFLAGNC